MGLLGLEKYPAFVAFKSFFHPDLNMIYQKKITKRGSLRTSTSASVSIQYTFAHDDVAFRFVAKFEQHHYLLIIYLVHRCLFNGSVYKHSQGTRVLLHDSRWLICTRRGRCDVQFLLTLILRAE